MKKKMQMCVHTKAVKIGIDFIFHQKYKRQRIFGSESLLKASLDLK